MQSKDVAVPGAPHGIGGRILKTLGQINPLVWVLIVLYIVLALLSDRFLMETNQINILRQVAVYLLIALGMTFVIASKGIDLSVGSALGLVACVTGTLISGGLPVWLGIVVALSLGTLIGTVNGLIITKLNVAPLITTLGMLVALRGAVHLYMGGDVVTRFPESLTFLGWGTLGPIPMPVVISIIAVAAVWYLYNQTRFGRYTASIGSNEHACRLVGINVERHKVFVYAFQGLMVGIAAVVLLGRMNAASPQFGQLYELHVIAAVVLGGTALYGGIGTVIGTVLGILTIGVLENGMLLAGADFHTQRVLIGMLLIGAVAYQGYRQRKRALEA